MNFSYGAVFVAGLATFFSPCVLPLVPVLTANLISANARSRWGKLLSTAWFGVGFTLAFIVMGLGLSYLARYLPHARFALLLASGIILGIFGLKMAKIIDRDHKYSFFTRSMRLPLGAERWPGGLQGLVLGLAFGLSWTPCVGPILGGVLSYVASSDRSAGEGTLLLASFSLGIVIPLLLVAGMADSLQGKIRALGKYTPKVEALAGVALVVFSLYLVQQAFAQAPSTARAPVAIAAAPGAATPPRARLLFFHSEHCPICRQMEKFLPRVEADCNSSDFQIVRMDVDSADNRDAVNEFRIHAVPTIAVIDAKGKEIIHLVGFQSEETLREAAGQGTTVACRNSASPNPPPSLKDFTPREGQTCEAGKAC